MRRLLVALLVSFLCTISAPQFAEARPAAVKGAYYLKVRAAPDFDATPVAVLSAGEIVEVTEEAGRWATVRLEDGRTGYVSRKYLAPVGSTAAAETSPAREAAKPAVDLRENQGGPTVKSEPKVRTEDQRPPVTAPQAAVTGAGQTPPRRPGICTTADLREVRRQLQELAAGQERLTALLEVGGADPAARDWRSSLSARQVLFWLAAGCVLGWILAAGLGRHERRQRTRIRV